MNIPRQFYGMNYISRLFGNFQDSELSEYPKIMFHEIEDIKPVSLTLKDTLSLGLNAKEVSDLLRKMVSDRRCALDGIAIAKGEDMLFAKYQTPYTEKYPRITNSACKTVIAIGVMFAVSEGLLNEEDTLLSFFPEYETMLTPKYVKQITIKHLLTMTSGSKTNEITSLVETNWVKAFLLTDCQYEPGSKFIYNSMNTYMLAAILTKVTGKSVMDYLKPRLFAPLGINHIKWELCPEGIERGGWGLHISLEGMLKIGMFLMNDGVFQGKQLIDKSYIKRMKELHVEQDADSLSVGYGYQLWHLPDNLYMLSGMYGQNVIIDECHKLVIATNAHTDKMFPDSRLVRYILEFINKENVYVPAASMKEKMAYYKLKQNLEAFEHEWELPAESSKIPYFAYKEQQKRGYLQGIAKLRGILTVFDGRRLHVDQTAFKLFPYMLQAMYQYPPFFVTDISWKCQNDVVNICFYKEHGKKDKKEMKKREKLILEAGICRYQHQVIRLGAEQERLAVKCYPATDEDGHNVLKINIVFPDKGFSRVIKFFLLEERIMIECQEYPDMRAIVEQVIYGEAVLAGNTIDLTDKLPESVRVMLEHKVEPRVNAYFK